jgi:hypothetical protein
MKVVAEEVLLSKYYLGAKGIPVKPNQPPACNERENSCFVAVRLISEQQPLAGPRSAAQENIKLLEVTMRARRN